MTEKEIAYEFFKRGLEYFDGFVDCSPEYFENTANQYFNMDFSNLFDENGFLKKEEI
jgi:hypothetical protein